VAGNGWYRKEKAIAALLQCNSIVEASEACGVSTRTFTRWLANDEEFNKRLRDAKLKLVEDAIDDLRRGCKGFVNVLVEIAHDKIAPHAARVSAAKTGLQVAIDSGQLQDVMRRLLEIEKRNNPEWNKP
jgi:hypothetical protein